MLIFHEGLPGAGKTYAAIQDHLLPAVKKGRKVYTNIRGINHENISTQCGITTDQAVDLVHVFPMEKTKDMLGIVEDNALVIIDELQNFWPKSGKPLSNEDMLFVTEHRQRGLELVCTGQVRGDCHNVWKGRIDRLLEFQNREAIGKPTTYVWRAFNKTGQDSRGQPVFEYNTSGTDEYKPEVYNCYKSHRDGVTEIEKTKDNRFNVFATRAFKLWIPAAFIAGFVAVGYLWQFFHPVPVASASTVHHESVRPTGAGTAPAAVAPPAVVSQPVPSAAVVDAPVPKAAGPDDYIEVMLVKYRPRLSGVIYNATKMMGQIEFMDDGYRSQERMSIDDLRGMGWRVSRQGQGVLLQKNGHQYIVTSWPVEPFGSNAQAVRNSPAVSGA